MTALRYIRRILLASLAALSIPCSVLAAETALVVRNITIVDPAAENASSAHRKAMIVIVGPRIEAILAPGSPVPAGAHVIDASGKFAVPAFWDMHAHVPGDPVRARAALQMQFANGVLHMRDMGTDMPLADLKQLKSLTATRNEPLARIIATPWRIVHGRDDHTPRPDGDAARFLVEDGHRAADLIRFVRQQRIDFIKPYDSMSAPTFRALASAAKAADMPISGHIPRQIAVGEAIDLGQTTIEHAQALTWACAPAPDAARRTYYLEDPHRRFGRNLDYPGFAAFAAATVDSYDKDACRKLMQAMVRRDVHYIPTLVTRRFDVLAAFREYRDDPLLAYIDSTTRRHWARDAANYAALDTASRMALYRFLLHSTALTGEAYRTGVPILVGSDAPDSYIFPGFSYHLEMEMLAEAGIPPLAILKAATVQAVRFSKEDRDYGSLAPGRLADLLILDADPLSDISNSRRIHAVIAAGHLWDRAALDGLLAKVRAVAADTQGELP